MTTPNTDKHTPRPVARAMEMLRVAGGHCAVYAAEYSSRYDEADCDGTCIQEDAAAAADGLALWAARYADMLAALRDLMNAYERTGDHKHQGLHPADTLGEIGDCVACAARRAIQRATEGTDSNA